MIETDVEIVIEKQKKNIKLMPTTRVNNNLHSDELNELVSFR